MLLPSFCKPDALTFALHAYAGYTLFWTCINMFESPCLDLLSPLLLYPTPPPLLEKSYPNTNQPTWSLHPLPMSLPGLSNYRLLYTCLYYSRLRYWTTRNRLYAQSMLKLSKEANSKLVYISYPLLQKCNKGSCQFTSPLSAMLTWGILYISPPLLSITCTVLGPMSIINSSFQLYLSADLLVLIIKPI